MEKLWKEEKLKCKKKMINNTTMKDAEKFKAEERQCHSLNLSFFLLFAEDFVHCSE